MDVRRHLLARDFTCTRRGCCRVVVIAAGAASRGLWFSLKSGSDAGDPMTMDQGDYSDLDHGAVFL